MSRRPLKWIAGTLALLAVLILVLVNITHWNWLRGPLSRQISDMTGRELLIRGDLEIRIGWPRTHVRMAEVTFANPSWAEEKNMIAVRNVAFDVSMPPLMRRDVEFDYVSLDRAVVFLEKSSDGRKNWLLDRKQRDNEAQIKINHVTVNDGQVDYLDPVEKTRLSARISMLGLARDKATHPLSFKVQGQYKKQAVVAQGVGGSVLAFRDDTTPYPLKIKGRIGPTTVSLNGYITDLLKLSAVDLKIGIRGDSLAQLYPLLGIVLPDTLPYSTQGRLLRTAEVWRYEKFSGQIGKSDIAGTLQVNTQGKRVQLKAKLNSRRLDFADLGPLIGTAQPGAVNGGNTPPPGRVLPVTPFRTERWGRMDADVTLTAHSIKRDKALPINNLSSRLQLRDSVLTLNPLHFGVAGGTLGGSIKLDGNRKPIHAVADLKARKIQIAQLFPTFDLNKASIGQVNGNAELKGQGDTVAALLGSADGQLAMVVDGGEISKLMMETVSLHLLEMLQLKIAGDKPIRIRCGIADFRVNNGVMQASTLMLDTDIARIDASGNIDLGDEKLDLTVVPKTKKFSLVALRSPIHVKGSFAKPQVALDKGSLVKRGLSALALGIVNPVLALVPLIETGPGKDSDCGRLILDAKTLDHPLSQ